GRSARPGYRPAIDLPGWSRDAGIGRFSLDPVRGSGEDAGERPGRPGRRDDAAPPPEGTAMRRTLTLALLALAAAATPARAGTMYTFVNFDDPNGVGHTVANGINAAGQVVGSYSNGSGNHGFVRSADGSSFTNFDDPKAGPFGTFANGINGAGQVAGWYSDSAGANHGFVRSADGSTFTNFDNPA